MKKKPFEPVSEIVSLLDRVVTQAGLTQFQLKVINRRLDTLEKTAPPRRQQKRARRKP